MNRYVLRLSMKTGREGEGGRDLVLCFTARNGIGREDLLEAIRKSSVEFCSTEEGSAIFEEKGSVWDYIDFAKFVPNETCKKYGIEKVDGHGSCTSILLTKDVFLSESNLVSPLDIEDFLGLEMG